MNESCAEDCAIKRDCSRFELKPSVTLEDLPRYPLAETKGMTKEEKFTSLAVYITKLAEYLKGEENGDNTYYSRSRQVFKALQKQNILLGETQRITPHPDRKECAGVGSGSTRLDPKEEEQPIPTGVSD
jgi:hypothetical protein